MNTRLEWVDNAKGFGLFLVIYGHNNPFLEPFIYSFHMPLFFFIAGMFHPEVTSINSVINRVKRILVPYFLWSFLLYVFWFFLGRHFGDSLNYNLDPLDGFIGIFYAQGGKQFMDWGIPMWFLPCIFLSFLIFSLVKLIKIKQIQIIVTLILVLLGFAYSYYFDFKLPWSFDVACVSLVFYASGYYLKEKVFKLNSLKIIISLILISLLCTVLSLYNIKVDMYRSTYGYIPLFIVNGFAGSLLILLFFKISRSLSFLAYLGKNTITLLALQFRALTFIKVVLICVGINYFHFNEPTKFILVFIQILLISFVIFIINRLRIYIKW